MSDTEDTCWMEDNHEIVDFYYKLEDDYQTMLIKTNLNGVKMDYNDNDMEEYMRLAGLCNDTFKEVRLNIGIKKPSKKRSKRPKQ